MSRNTKFVLLIILACALGLLLLGCGGSKQQQQPQQPQQQAHTMEDPAPILSQMNQTLNDVESKVKANQIGQAQQSANTLVGLNDRLSQHFSDTAFRDNLHHSILGLKDELSKANPNQNTVNSQIQSIRNLLGTAPSKLMRH